MDRLTLFFNAKKEESSGGTPEDVALSMMHVKDLVAPLLDAADGMRSDLLARNYSEELAGQMAMHYLSLLMLQAFKGA